MISTSSTSIIGVTLISAEIFPWLPSDIDIVFSPNCARWKNGHYKTEECSTGGAAVAGKPAPAPPPTMRTAEAGTAGQGLGHPKGAVPTSPVVPPPGKSTSPSGSRGATNI